MTSHTQVMSTLQVPDGSDALDEVGWGAQDAAAASDAQQLATHECAAQVRRSVEQRMPWLASLRALPDEGR